MSTSVSKDLPASRLSCANAGICSGCDLIELDRTSLASHRSQTLARLGLAEKIAPETRWIQTGGLRDRLEFTLEADPAMAEPPRLGLLKVAGSREIVDIEVCPQLSPELQLWLTDFRQDLPPIRSRGSVRLRVSPQSERGVWLDFANEDILHLLEESAWLERQLEADVIVEMGQKRKRAVRSNSGPRAHKLGDPVFTPWFRSWIRSGVDRDLLATPLFGTIGTFTQPGFLANRVLVETVLDHMKESGPRGQNHNLQIAEFGCGIGSFTLPLLSTGASVHVFESDTMALEALELGVEAARLDRRQLTVHQGDFILSSKAADRAKSKMPASTAISSFDVVVVDPPRPGLGDFIASLAEKTRGAEWIYVSCYPESFAKDRLALRQLGLELQRMTIVEQFPFTRHFEIVASFKPVELKRSIAE